MISANPSPTLIMAVIPSLSADITGAIVSRLLDDTLPKRMHVLTHQDQTPPKLLNSNSASISETLALELNKILNAFTEKESRESMLQAFQKSISLKTSIISQLQNLYQPVN